MVNRHETLKIYYIKAFNNLAVCTGPKKLKQTGVLDELD